MKTCLLLIILIYALMMPDAYARDIKLLQGVNLIDGRGNYFPDFDILIEGDVITGIGPTVSVETVKIANLVALEQNPLEDIEALKTLIFTMKNGVVYYRSDFSSEE